MADLDKLIRIASVPYSAFVSVIFGIMIISFPIGAYLVFDSDIGKNIDFHYPIHGFSFFIGGIPFTVPLSFQLGDAFVIAWSVYIVLFSISFVGPLGSLTKTLAYSMYEGFRSMRENGLINAISWLTILILFSVAIDYAQRSFGVKIEPPHFQNGLVQFFLMTTSPITEELGFRVLLIGIPLFLIFSHRSSLKLFFQSLWRPSSSLQITDYRKAWALIIAVGIFFGAAHIMSNTPWSAGKITQATLGGIILGWVYTRYGLGPAVIVHWGTNYFVYSYQFLISALSQAPLSSQASNPFSDTLEQLLIITGALAITIKVLTHLKNRKKIQSTAGTSTKES